MTYDYAPPPADNRKLKRNIIIGVAVVIVLVIGLFVFRFATAPKGGMPGGGGMGVPVMSENPRPEKTSGTVQAVGTLRADQSINIAPEVDGRISAIPAVEGSVVKAGDVLAELDQTITKADVAEAEANLALAQATYGRTRGLAQRQFATRQSEDEALASLRQAQARAASAKARYEKTQIIAPFDGKIGLRQKSVGAYVKAGEVIFPLTSIDPVFVDFRVPELKAPEVAMGQKVAVNIPALGGTPVEGEVIAIDPALDEAGRSLAVRAKLPNRDGKLYPGLFAQVSLAYSTPRDVLVVSERAVFLQGSDAFVYRAVDGKAEMAKVTIATRRVGEVEILDGITANDDVITDGQIKLRPGAPVMLLSKPNIAANQAGGKAPEAPKKEEAPKVDAPAPAVPAAPTEEAKPQVAPGEAPKADAPPPAFVPAPVDKAPEAAPADKAPATGEQKAP